MSHFHASDIRSKPSILGPDWVSVYECDVDFKVEHFDKAMSHVIREPNFNSTVIMRAEIISENIVAGHANDKASSLEHELVPIDENTMKLTVNIDDIKPRIVDLKVGDLERMVVRRIIPRNPLRDPVINQSCLVFTNWKDAERNVMAIVYTPHLEEGSTECPFYLPPAKSVGILFRENSISVHYIPFEKDREGFATMDESARINRIALHLLQTAYRHSRGVMTGYEKRVHHDVVVDKVLFQNKYIELKQKYAKSMVDSWVESTDPKKHVFEDLAIAAFLITLWNETYSSSGDFKFIDIGCGNGLLVHLLISEGYTGIGIDARARKSWKIYPEKVQSYLKEQVVIPEIVLRSNPDNVYVDPSGQEFKYSDLIHDPKICTFSESDSKKPLFLIGNHADELTCWIPLLGFPHMVIPCCSHSISGAKARFTPKSEARKSRYAALVDHVVDLQKDYGWVSEVEILRIPSTRNAAIIGRTKSGTAKDIEKILEDEGGVEGWVDRTMFLRSKSSRGH